MTGWPRVRLGELLEQRGDGVEVEATMRYRIGGIYSFGRGMFERATISGAETKYRQLFRVREDQFVYSKLKAWEGALTVVEPEYAGLHVSTEFPIFDLDRRRLDPDFLACVARWRGFVDRIAAATTGIGARRERVSPKDMMKVTIPLPPLDEQRLIAVHLSHVGRITASIAAQDVGLMKLAPEAAMESYLASLTHEGWRTTSIASVTDLNPPRARVDGGALVNFVPRSAVDDITGTIRHAERRRAADVAKGYTQFLSGDVIFARIAPCMQNGKAAIFGPTDGVQAAYGSTEFHVLRPQGVSAAWLRLWVRRMAFRQRAMAAFTGTAGQQRVPAAFVADAEIMVAPCRRAEEAAVDRLTRLEHVGVELRRRRSERETLLAALPGSVLNEVFSGRL